ncbi:ABC transporter substrate-binding protein [Leifsonia flava]|uniref:Sugar ABC transporter substrate-binding protein n=1 Tax=Orlajensenia leifsoniae TaxID=2561933 RepID=A0A4Y9R6J1_9MICO|nr:sugar ABC transporter substrate-binding protein [Leifsonia flava]TFV99917.1 sugar ABC transporter substrate-binding protein [Leifsonia flava]
MSSTSRWRRSLKKTTVIGAVGLAVIAGLTGCAGATPAAAPETSAADMKAAVDKGADLTLWTWSTNVQNAVDAFEKLHPKVKIEIVNVGTGAAHYTKLENAIKAGSGAPDLATIEYSALPQFALKDALVDLNKFGFDKLEKQFTASTWNNVNVNGGLYELPHNAAPMALFYNKTVFDKYGVDVPTTWDEYADAAAKLHAANPDTYIAADTGDAGTTTSMIWAAGGHPFSTTGDSTVKIDLADKGTKKVADLWTPLINDKLLLPAAGWSTEWYQGLANGNIATLTAGAWMAGTLASGVPTGAGQWRVAPLPTYEKGEKASAENGGGGYAVLKQSSTQKQLVAAAFIKFMDAGDGVQVMMKAGQFPSTVADLDSDAFLSAKNDFFGGQEVNKVFAQSAKDVLPGWQYLPYQAYANSVFGDTVGQAYNGSTTLSAGLLDWQSALEDYGTQQGFTVTK